VCVDVKGEYDVNDNCWWDAYGNCSILEPNFAPDPDGKIDYGNPYAFQGKRLDLLDNGGLELMYWPYRYYSTYLGRWTQAEKLGIIPNDNERVNAFAVQRQYKDGMNLYEYAQSSPVNRIDSFGLCSEKVTIKGHGVFIEGSDKEVKKCKVKPVGMTKGIKGDIILLKHDIKAMCAEFCCGATLSLQACCIGRNESYMKEVASGCCKIKRVCGYTKYLKYIPWTEITFPMPWNWKCIDVNKE